MDTNIIKAMVQALKPALKDRKRAEEILNRFWRDKIVLVWDAKDVHTAANEQEIALTEKEARFVLQQLEQYYNKQYGIKWEDLAANVDGFGLGRKMTKAEVNRFVKKNIITVAP